MSTVTVPLSPAVAWPRPCGGDNLSMPLACTREATHINVSQSYGEPDELVALCDECAQVMNGQPPMRTCEAERRIAGGPCGVEGYVRLRYTDWAYSAMPAGEVEQEETLCSGHFDENFGQLTAEEQAKTFTILQGGPKD